MTQKITAAIALAIVCLLAFGCQTYVNIPPQDKDTANHNPNGKTVRTVMALAVRAALDDGGITRPVQVMFPENTNKLSYAQIISAIGDQAVSPYQEDVSRVEGVVFAKGVRIRGTRAEVDVARPVGDGVDQLVTVYLTWKPLSSWHADRVHTWRGVAIDESAASASPKP